MNNDDNLFELRRIVEELNNRYNQNEIKCMLNIPQHEFSKMLQSQAIYYNKKRAKSVLLRSDEAELLKKYEKNLLYGKQILEKKEKPEINGFLKNNLR